MDNQSEDQDLNAEDKFEQMEHLISLFSLADTSNTNRINKEQLIKAI